MKTKDFKIGPEQMYDEENHKIKIDGFLERMPDVFTGSGWLGGLIYRFECDTKNQVVSAFLKDKDSSLNPTFIYTVPGIKKNPYTYNNSKLQELFALDILKTCQLKYKNEYIDSPKRKEALVAYKNKFAAIKDALFQMRKAEENKGRKNYFLLKITGQDINDKYSFYGEGILPWGEKFLFQCNEKKNLCLCQSAETGYIFYLGNPKMKYGFVFGHCLFL